MRTFYFPFCKATFSAYLTFLNAIRNHMIKTIFLLLASAICINSFAQVTGKCDDKFFKDELLDKLEGKWQLTGNIGGRNVENNFSAQWVLNHQFMELIFEDVATPPSYMAHVYIGYDCVSERYVVHWFDFFGGRLSETLGYGTASGQTINLRFEYPDGPFINQIIYNPATDSWQLHMTSKDSGGSWKLF